MSLHPSFGVAEQGWRREATSLGGLWPGLSHVRHLLPGEVLKRQTRSPPLSCRLPAAPRCPLPGCGSPLEPLPRAEAGTPQGPKKCKDGLLSVPRSPRAVGVWKGAKSPGKSSLEPSAVCQHLFPLDHCSPENCHFSPPPMLRLPTTPPGQLAKTLQQVQVELINSSTCNADNAYQGEVTENMLCAGGGGSDTCQVSTKALTQFRQWAGGGGEVVWSPFPGTRALKKAVRRGWPWDREQAQPQA